MMNKLTKLYDNFFQLKMSKEEYEKHILGSLKNHMVIDKDILKILLENKNCTILIRCED